MILGMSVYFLMHGVLGVVGILAGFFLLSGLLAAKRLEGWTAIFLAATVATSFKGVGFPFVGLTPAIAGGVPLLRRFHRGTV